MPRRPYLHDLEHAVVKKGPAGENGSGAIIICGKQQNQIAGYRSNTVGNGRWVRTFCGGGCNGSRSITKHQHRRRPPTGRCHDHRQNGAQRRFQGLRASSAREQGEHRIKSNLIRDPDKARKTSPRSRARRHRCADPSCIGRPWRNGHPRCLARTTRMPESNIGGWIPRIQAEIFIGEAAHNSGLVGSRTPTSLRCHCRKNFCATGAEVTATGGPFGNTGTAR